MKTTDPSYVLRINKATGKTVWRIERPTKAIRESPDSYATPAVLKYGSQVEIVVNGGDCITGHDPVTGKELWRGNGFNPDNRPDNRIIASPLVFDGIVYAPTRVRSEERRVGKECRCRWPPDHNRTMRLGGRAQSRKTQQMPSRSNSAVYATSI